MTVPAVKDSAEVVGPGLTLDDAVEVIRLLKDAGAIDSGATFLELTDPDIPFEQYESLGAALGTMNRACMWWIGDWLNYGENAYGDRYYQAAAATGLSEQTLMNRKSICKKIPRHRRKIGVKFSVHSEVAYLPPREQIHWLSLTARHGWGQKELRERIHTGNENPASLNNSIPGNLPATVSKDGDGDVDGPFSLIDVARAVIRDATQTPEGDWVVPSEDMSRLVAACGWSE